MDKLRKEVTQSRNNQSLFTRYLYLDKVGTCLEPCVTRPSPTFLCLYHLPVFLPVKEAAFPFKILSESELGIGFLREMTGKQRCSYGPLLWF